MQAGTRAATHVLLVEDNPADAALIQAQLRPNGERFEVDWVPRLRDVTSASIDKCDVVVLDLSLPDGNGVETVEFVVARTQKPIVVLTGSQEGHLPLAVLARGAQDFVPKAELSGHRLRRSISYAIFRARAERVREMEADLARQAEHSNRLSTLGQLAAGVAHEINNPTSYILANVTLIAERLTELRRILTPHAPKVFDAFNDIESMLTDSHEGIDRIVETVRTLSNFAKLDTGDIETRSLTEAAEVALKVVKNELHHRVQLISNVSDTPVLPLAFPRIVQVIVNLLMNALHAVEDVQDPTIRLAVTVDGAAIQLTVEDNGGGIPTELQPRIFEPFFTTKARSGGSGLGLSISHETAALHGGTLALDESSEGLTRFVLSLPTTNDLIAKGAPTRDAPQPQQSARVLVIDDEPAVLRALSRSLGTQHNVTSARGGQAAIDALAQNPAFDVVICDLMMPGVDGLDVLHHIREVHPHLEDRMLFATAGAFTTRMQHIQEQHGARVLFKPIARADLFAAIEGVVVATRERRWSEASKQSEQSSVGR